VWVYLCTRMTFTEFKTQHTASCWTWDRVDNQLLWFEQWKFGDELWRRNYNGGVLARSSTMFLVRNDEILEVREGDLTS
jgi:hypothetical protein